MKKILMFLAIILLCITLSGATIASITLTGTVSAHVSVSVVEENLPLDLTTSVTDLKVGTLTEKSNKSGYSIEIASTNSGKLIGDVSSEELTYTAKYDGSSFVLSSTAVEVLASGSKTSGTDKDIVISYTIVEYELSPSVYSDTITITIVAN
jgi:hypothetical protein